MNLKRSILREKRPISDGYNTVQFYFYNILKMAKFGNGKQISDCHRVNVAGKEKYVCLSNVNSKNKCGGGTVLSLDCNRVSMLAVTMQLSFAKYYHCRKPGEEYMKAVHFLKTTWEPTSISELQKIQYLQ